MHRSDFIRSSAVLTGSLVFGQGNVFSMVPKTTLTKTARDGMRMVVPKNRFVVADTPGIYHHSVGIVYTPAGILCVYRTSDDHIASWSDINTALSSDGGKTWKDHRVIAKSSYEKDSSCYVAPQTSGLMNGSIMVLADKGVKKSAFDWPMLSEWQKPDRGMSNYLLVSRDNGATWEGIRKVDDVGGEPSYIIRLSDGTLMYTRTDSAPTNSKKNPDGPWLNNYYKNTAVFSDDNGNSWSRTVPIFDDPLIGDCEVGIVEYQPGNIIAISRIGDAGSKYAQPSRMALSEDYGRTWSKPFLSPIYAHRPCVGKLANGNLFVSFRAANNGVFGTYAWQFDPKEKFSYQPHSYIWKEECCQLKNDGLHIQSNEGVENAVEFFLYPMEDDESACEVEATFAVKEADTHGCIISAGAMIQFLPGRISLFEKPGAGFDMDTTSFHQYRIINKDQQLRIFVDGILKMDVPIKGVFSRFVKFGNQKGGKPLNTTSGNNYKGRLTAQGYNRNRSLSIWKSIRVNVQNMRDHSVSWEWNASSGKYPDQYRRDRIVKLEANASFILGNSGYSSWTQRPDGTVVVADYTCTDKGLAHPLVRVYHLSPADLRVMMT